MTGNSIVLSGLLAKRAHLAGQLEEAKIALANLVRDIEAIDHAIHLFDPTVDVLAIPTRSKRMTRVRARIGGDVGRDVLDIVREGKQPLSVEEIAAAIIAQRQLDAGDERVASIVRSRVYSALRRSTAQGVLRMGGDAGRQVWEVAR